MCRMRSIFSRAAKTRSSRLMERQGPTNARGLFTVEYPYEKLPMSENFRIIPFLVYNSETGQERCTSCGICAKVCPPQCIWIVRGHGSRDQAPQAGAGRVCD